MKPEWSNTVMCVFVVQEMSSEFITEDKLDIEIEKLLNSRVSYEFALKPDGTILESEEFGGPDAKKGSETDTVTTNTKVPPES